MCFFPSAFVVCAKNLIPSIQLTLLKKSIFLSCKFFTMYLLKICSTIILLHFFLEKYQLNKSTIFTTLLRKPLPSLSVYAMAISVFPTWKICKFMLFFHAPEILLLSNISERASTPPYSSGLPLSRNQFNNRVMCFVVIWKIFRRHPRATCHSFANIFLLRTLVLRKTISL